MRTIVGLGFFLAVGSMIDSSNHAAAQTQSKAMAMPTSTLLVAQLDSKQVVGGSSSRATGTGAFLIDPVHHALTYSLTYEGLKDGSPKSIALSNFGKGKNGEVFKVLCGAQAQPCPSGNSGTISGKFERGDNRALDNHVIGEFDSQRVYVEVVGGNGEREIRGQLAPNGAMAPFANYLAHLEPVRDSESKGTGTAIVSEVYLPGGKVSVFYAATVAGTSGPPVKAGFAVDQAASTHPFAPRLALPKLELLSPREERAGGSFQGLFEVDSAEPGALFVKPLTSAGHGEVEIVITTSRHPDGELFGILVPVR
jgi:hypothetical protein